jgi:hypothetical protein
MEIGKYKIRVNAIARGLNLDDEFSLSVVRERAEKLMKEAAPLERWLNVKNDLASRVYVKLHLHYRLVPMFAYALKYIFLFLLQFISFLVFQVNLVLFLCLEFFVFVFSHPNSNFNFLFCFCIPFLLLWSSQ